MAQTLLIVIEWYGLAGLLVAAVFLLFGIDRVDPASHGAYAVRPLLVPGVIVLWPLVLWRWIELERARDQHTEEAGS